MGSCPESLIHICVREPHHNAVTKSPTKSHTAAELDLDQIWHLVDDLIDAHGTEFLPEFATRPAAVAAD